VGEDDESDARGVPVQQPQACAHVKNRRDDARGEHEPKAEGVYARLPAAVFHLTNLYAPSTLFHRLGLWAATGGVFFNLASWLVRWVTSYERELSVITRQGGEMPWFFRYIPFANLYDLSLAFGAGLATLLIAHRRSFRFLGALTLPIASIILILARFIGGEIVNLPPVLDSYWRPIHVGTASLSYGVALVCFAAAVVYLLKDGVKTEAMAIWSSLFALAVIATVSRFSVFAPATFGTYGASAFFGTGEGRGMSLPLRVDLPYVGWLLVASGTPTFLSPEELENLIGGILEGVRLTPDAEFSIESDPRVTTR
jgi:hypothetical protein